MAVIRLRLAWQDLKKRFDSKLWTKILSAKTMGERIFGIKSTLLLEKKPLSDLLLPTYTETLGKYDFVNDIIQIYYKRIESHCEKLHIDADSVLLNTICHEIGHAKEARLFEKENLFPYRFNVFQGNFPIIINSRSFDLNRIWLGKDFYKIFLIGIQDYAIDAELRKNNIETPLSHIEVQNIPEIQKLNVEKEQWDRLCLETLLLLSHRVNLFANGGLIEQEKKKLEKYNKAIVGDKWNFTVETMKRLEHNSLRNYPDVLCKLFEENLGLKIFQKMENSKTIFDCYKNKPELWTSDNYRVFYLAPMDIGKQMQTLYSLFDSL